MQLSGSQHFRRYSKAPDRRSGGGRVDSNKQNQKGRKNVAKLLRVITFSRSLLGSHDQSVSDQNLNHLRGADGLLGLAADHSGDVVTARLVLYVRGKRGAALGHAGPARLVDELQRVGVGHLRRAHLRRRHH